MYNMYPPQLMYSRGGWGGQRDAGTGGHVHPPTVIPTGDHDPGAPLGHITTALTGRLVGWAPALVRFPRLRVPPGSPRAQNGVRVFPR